MRNVWAAPFGRGGVRKVELLRLFRSVTCLRPEDLHFSNGASAAPKKKNVKRFKGRFGCDARSLDSLALCFIAPSLADDPLLSVPSANLDASWRLPRMT